MALLPDPTLAEQPEPTAEEAASQGAPVEASVETPAQEASAEEKLDHFERIFGEVVPDLADDDDDPANTLESIDERWFARADPQTKQLLRRAKLDRKRLEARLKASGVERSKKLDAREAAIKEKANQLNTAQRRLAETLMSDDTRTLLRKADEINPDEVNVDPKALLKGVSFTDPESIQNTLERAFDAFSRQAQNQAVLAAADAIRPMYAKLDQSRRGYEVEDHMKAVEGDYPFYGTPEGKKAAAETLRAMKANAIAKARAANPKLSDKDAEVLGARAIKGRLREVAAHISFQKERDESERRKQAARIRAQRSNDMTRSKRAEKPAPAAPEIPKGTRGSERVRLLRQQNQRGKGLPA